MIVKVIIFFLFFGFAFGEETGIFKIKGASEGNVLSVSNSLTLKNIFLNYKQGIDSSTQEFDFILRKKTLSEITDDLYYVLNYNCEFFNGFSNHLNSFNTGAFEPKLGIYINNNFYISLFFETVYKD